jgi:transposase
LEQVNEVVLYQVQECQHCHHCLESQPTDIIERRQVIDLPAQCLWVTEHHSEEKLCPACGLTTRAPFPKIVRAVTQYGPRIQALGVYLVEGQMVPYARASQMLRAVFGLQISASSLHQWVRTCSQALCEVETRIKERQRKASVIHQDETGVPVCRHHSYVRVCSTPADPLWISQEPGPSRSQRDRHPSRLWRDLHPRWLQHLFQLSLSARLCNVHHLRGLTFMEEVLKQLWAKKMKELLLDMMEEVAQARQAGQTQLDVLKFANFHFQYGALIREGLELNPKVPPPPGGKRVKQSPAWNLLDRLHRYREATLRFLHDFAVRRASDLGGGHRYRSLGLHQGSEPARILEAPAGPLIGRGLALLRKRPGHVPDRVADRPQQYAQRGHQHVIGIMLLIAAILFLLKDHLTCLLEAQYAKCGGIIISGTRQP